MAFPSGPFPEASSSFQLLTSSAKLPMGYTSRLVRVIFLNAPTSPSNSFWIAWRPFWGGELGGRISASSA